MMNTASLTENTEARRTANYKPNIWNYDHMMSLTSKYNEDKYRREVETLKTEVSEILRSEKDLLQKLELIDEINKLALSHYFLDEISIAFNAVARSKKLSDDLYTAASYLRNLRHYEYNNVQKDMIFQLMEDENKMTHMSSNRLHYANYPSQGSIIWFNVKNNLNHTKNTSLHKLAGLSFNLVQDQHQKELKSILRWWKDLGVSEVLTFTRNRVIESFLWTVGVAYEPQYGNLRKWLTKAIVLSLIIDDVYDIYGTIHEIEQFTNAVQSWDGTEIQKLPEEIKKCFWILQDTVYEIDLEVQKEKGWDSILPHLKEVWADFCNAMFVEAKWYHKGYRPSFQEYLDNGWVSSFGVVVSLHVLLGIGQDMIKTIKVMNDNQEIIRNVSLIMRLCNDQATSKVEMERGDAPSSILCYMREANATELEARVHVSNIIASSWNKINGLFMKSEHSSQKMSRYVINAAKVSSFIYEKGDGFSDQDQETREQVLSCLIEPFPLA